VAGAASPGPSSSSSMAGGRGGRGGPKPAVDDEGRIQYVSIQI